MLQSIRKVEEMNELKEKVCDFFNVENEKDWNDLLKEYCLENVFKS